MLKTGGDRRLKKSTKKLLTAMYRLSTPRRYRPRGTSTFCCLFAWLVLVGLDTITV